MELRIEQQQNPVADEVSALNAIIRPILAGILFALKKEVVAEVGGYEHAKLFMLPRLYRPGDGDCGICFEYAVHDAILRQEPSVADRIDTALNLCRIRGKNPASILFGAEKTGSVQLIATAKEILTPDSHLLYGARGRPVKLKRHIDSFAAAFRKQSLQANLPYSINGVWKADLFVGATDIDQWVGATVKTKQKDLEGARGLRIGLIPCESGKSDRVLKDDGKNLIICPLPYDGEFVELFFTAWNIVKQFIDSDAKLPKEAAVPAPAHRNICKYLTERREFPILDVIDALRPISQPELLTGDQHALTVNYRRQASAVTGAIIAPLPNANG